jgi:hypothetical protein
VPRRAQHDGMMIGVRRSQYDSVQAYDVVTSHIVR